MPHNRDFNANKIRKKIRNRWVYVRHPIVVHMSTENYIYYLNARSGTKKVWNKKRNKKELVKKKKRSSEIEFYLTLNGEKKQLSYVDTKIIMIMFKSNLYKLYTPEEIHNLKNNLSKKQTRRLDEHLLNRLNNKDDITIHFMEPNFLHNTCDCETIYKVKDKKCIIAKFEGIVHKEYFSNTLDCAQKLHNKPYKEYINDLSNADFFKKHAKQVNYKTLDECQRIIKKHLNTKKRRK